MSIARVPELGSNIVALKVRMPVPKAADERLASGLREFYQKGELTDVELVCAERTFLAHGAVLASQSEVFKAGLADISAGPGVGAAGRHQVRIAEIHNPEAVQHMLNYIYEVGSDAPGGEYNPHTLAVNTDVFRLAHNFQLPGLTEQATHWLAKDITTGNVVERLTICDDFALGELREKILVQLTSNKKALSEVSRNPQIMQYPGLMQAMLQQAAGAPDDSPGPAPKKKARKSV